MTRCEISAGFEPDIEKHDYEQIIFFCKVIWHI